MRVFKEKTGSSCKNFSKLNSIFLLQYKNVISKQEMLVDFKLNSPVLTMSSETCKPKLKNYKMKGLHLAVGSMALLKIVESCRTMNSMLEIVQNHSR